MSAACGHQRTLLSRAELPSLHTSPKPSPKNSCIFVVCFQIIKHLCFKILQTCFSRTTFKLSAILTNQLKSYKHAKRNLQASLNVFCCQNVTMSCKGFPTFAPQSAAVFLRTKLIAQEIKSVQSIYLN